MIHTLQRYVLAELTKVFLLSLSALTSLMMIVGIIRDGSSQNLPLTQLFQLIPFLLPDALRVAIPVTLLLAVTTLYGRMSGANEIVAIKALGISPVTILWPTWAIAFVLSLGSVLLNDAAQVWGRRGVERVVTAAIEEIAYSMLRTQRCYSSSSFAINVKRVEDRRLMRVSLSLAKRGNSPSINIDAEEAELRYDPLDGLLKVILRNGSVKVQGKMSFRFADVQEYEIPIRDPNEPEEQHSASSLPLHSIPDWMEKLRAAQRKQQVDMAAHAAYDLLGGSVEKMAGPFWDNAYGAVFGIDNALHRGATEIPRRWANGFSCFFFVWAGAPLAIRMRNSDYLTSFFLCFLPILIVYYPLMMYSVDGAKDGNLPAWSVWIGNLLLTLWGTHILRRVMRY